MGAGQHPSPDTTAGFDPDRLVEGHLALAQALARRFGDVPPGREDLGQAAMVGLVAAARRFDPGRGVAFSTFAVPIILGELRETVRRASGFGSGRRLASEAARLRTARDRLRRALGREPDLDELADEMGVTRADLADVLGALAPAVPLDEGADTAIGPTPGHDDEAGIVDRLVLVRALADMPKTDRRILALRYVANMTQAQVAVAVGLSQSQVSRRERLGLRHLWHRLGPP